EGQLVKEGLTGFCVIADRVYVITSGAQESVHRAVVVRDPALVIGMGGIRVAAAGIVGRKGVSRMRDAVLVPVTESRLLTVRSRDPTEKVVETAIFHGDDHNVVDPG